MKKVCLLILVAIACKSRVESGKAMYNLMLSKAATFQSIAATYAHDNRPASLKRFAEAMDSAKLYEDSAITYLDEGQRAQMRRIDSLAKEDVRADKRYNDSVKAIRNGGSR